MVELLAVNRLIAPRSELSIHEKWFPQTAMAALLDSDERVAEKDRLYRALDCMVEHKEALEEHLAERWKDLFGATFDVLLYDLTSTGWLTLLRWPIPRFGVIQHAAVYRFGPDQPSESLL